MQLINLTTVIASLTFVSAQEHYQNVQQSCQTMGFCTPTNNDPTQCYNCQLDLSIKNQVYNQANGFKQGQSGFIEPQTPPSPVNPANPVAPTTVPQPSQGSNSANPPPATSGGDQPQPTPSSGNASGAQQSASATSSGSDSQHSGSHSSGSNNKSSSTTTQGNNSSMIGGSLMLGAFGLIASLFI